MGAVRQARVVPTSSGSQWACHARSRAVARTRPRPRWDWSLPPVYRPRSGSKGGDPVGTCRADALINWRDRRRDLDPTPETQKSWRRPIFPKGCPLSIFGAGELDFRVRDGNGYGLSASVTRIRCVWMLFGCDRAATQGDAGAVASIFDLGVVRDRSRSQPLTPVQLLTRSS